MPKGFAGEQERPDTVDMGSTPSGSYAQQQVNPSFETFSKTYGIGDIPGKGPTAAKSFFNKIANAFGGTVNYSNIMTPQQIQDQQLMAYGKFMQPYATNRTPQTVADSYGITRSLAPGTISVSRYGPTGAVPELGIAAKGLTPGQKTALGTAQAYRQDLSPLGRIAGLGANILVPGSGIMMDKGTQVMGVGSNVPISAKTGEALSPAKGGIMDLLFGGQSQSIMDAGGRLIDRVFKRSEEVQDTPMKNDETSVSPDLAGLSTLPTNAPYQQVAESTYSMPTPQQVYEALQPAVNSGILNQPQMQGQIGQGQYSIGVKPGIIGDERAIQFNYSRPLQDLGLGSLLG